MCIRDRTSIKGTTGGEELSFKLSFVAIGQLVLALRRVQTDGQTDITCFGKLGKAQRLRLWENQCICSLALFTVSKEISDEFASCSPL